MSVDCKKFPEALQFQHVVLDHPGNGVYVPTVSGGILGTTGRTSIPTHVQASSVVTHMR